MRRKVSVTARKKSYGTVETAFVPPTFTAQTGNHFIANNGFFDKVAEKDVKELQDNILNYIDEYCSAIGEEIDENKILSDETKQKILQAAEKFNAETK